MNCGELHISPKRQVNRDLWIRDVRIPACTPKMDQAAVESQDWQTEDNVRDWIAAELNKEASRVEATGTRVLKLPVQNYGLVCENENGKGRTITNRVQFSTTFNFDSVAQVMVSPSVPCEAKPGYKYCHVVLLNNSPVAMMFGYVHEGGSEYADNDLSRWDFVNKAGKHSMHIVQF